MRFDIAVASILVAEDLSSSVDAAAQGTPHASDLREIARLRKEAIEAISNRNPNGRREYRMFQRTRQQQQQQLRKGGSSRKGRNLFEDKIRQFSEDRRLQQFPGTATTITNQQLKNKATAGDGPIIDSDIPDLGIIPLTPTKAKEQLRNHRKDKILQHLSSITNLQQQLQNKRASGDSGPSSHSGVPDLGILPSVLTKAKRNIIKDRIQKLLGAANPQRKKGSSSGDLATSSNDTLPDLEIISSAPTKEHHNDKIPFGSIPSTYHKDYRRLQEGLVKYYTTTTFAKDFCAGLEYIDTISGAATPSCDICQVTYVDDNDPESAYNLELYCPNIPQEYAGDFRLSVFEYPCSDGLCQETCNVDTNNFLVDMKDCSFPNDVNTNLMAPFAKDFCARLEYIDTISGAATPSCETCQVTYVDDNNPESAYNLEIDCPNIPQEYVDDLLSKISGFENFCSFGACQETCNVDKENFLVDMKDCSFSDSGYDLESIFNMTNDTTDDISGVYGVETLAYVFDNYFSSICEPPDGVDQEFTCKACGRKSSDEASSFSFEFDCPQSDSGFGAYMILADSVCNCPDLWGVKCSICEVNPWEHTINIDDCVPIAEVEQASYCGNSEQTYFIAVYERSCNPVESYYLQDSIDVADCDCTFDESTQTASFSCQYEEVCQDVPSYCPENPLEFCTSYRLDWSIARYGTVSLHRCVNISSPYQFSYCVNYGISEDGAATAVAATVPNDTIKPQGYPVCEMEVDGIRCNSCSLLSYEKGNRTGLFSAMENMNVYYNCSNTVVGTNGQGNLSDYKIIDDTVSYFIYKSLPCRGGCDLCGGNDGPKNELMAKPDGIFTSEFWKNGTEERCFDAQLDAMTRKQILNNDECQAVRDSAREPCGCKNLNPQPEASGAHSFGKRKTTAGAVLLTMAAVSLVQHATWLNLF